MRGLVLQVRGPRWRWCLLTRPCILRATYITIINVNPGAFHEHCPVLGSIGSSMLWRNRLQWSPPRRPDHGSCCIFDLPHIYKKRLLASTVLLYIILWYVNILILCKTQIHRCLITCKICIDCSEHVCTDSPMYR